MKIYVVNLSRGAYSDYAEFNIEAHTNKQRAEERAQELKCLFEELSRAKYKVSGRVSRMHNASSSDVRLSHELAELLESEHDRLEKEAREKAALSADVVFPVDDDDLSARVIELDLIDPCTDAMKEDMAAMKEDIDYFLKMRSGQ